MGNAITMLVFLGAAHYLTSKYGWRTYTNAAGKKVTGYHRGCDYGTYGKNLPLYAIEDDAYVYSCGFDASAGYYIWVWYRRLNVRIAYFHMKAATPLKKGGKVTKGMLLGYTGSTGSSTGIHLHLGIRDAAGNYLDPEAYAKSYTNTQEDDNVKLKIIAPMDKPVSSQMVDEGVMAVMGADGVLRGYNLKGEARMVREYTQASKSVVFEAMKGEMRPYESIISVEE